MNKEQELELVFSKLSIPLPEQNDSVMENLQVSTMPWYVEAGLGFGAWISAMFFYCWLCRPFSVIFPIVQQ
ncbi:MAG: hypothetical protein HQL69_09350 [Magnetococcales bacterium]|nr:hypothetical protein [Magnetococcales bacterium]